MQTQNNDGSNRSVHQQYWWQYHWTGDPARSNTIPMVVSSQGFCMYQNNKERTSWANLSALTFCVSSWWSFIHSFIFAHLFWRDGGEHIALPGSRVECLSSVWALSALSLVNLQRERIRAESWRKSHGCDDLAVEVHGWNCTALRWKCCNTKAKCQGEGSVLTESVALELHNKGFEARHWSTEEEIRKPQLLCQAIREHKPRWDIKFSWRSTQVLKENAKMCRWSWWFLI